MNSEIFSNNLINSTIYYLLNFEKYKTFQQAARQAAINNNFQIVLLSDDFNTLFSVETRHLVTIEEVINSSFSQYEGREQKGVSFDVNGVSSYWGSCVISGNKYYLILVDNDKNYTQEEIVKLAEIIELAMGMWNYVPLRDPSTEFVRTLRRGNKELAASLAHEIKLSENDIAAVFSITDIKKKKDVQKVWADFSASQGMSSIVSSDQDEITGVVLKSPTLSSYNAEEWEVFGEKLHEAGASRAVHVRGLYSIEETCNAFRLIGETEAFTQIVFPYRYSFSKFELSFISNCLSLCVKGGIQKKNSLDVIRPLIQRTDLKTKQLKETLETFVLDAGLSTNKTAEIMDIHANTVQYRLKRIREMLGVDITSSTVLPALMTALAVSRIEKEAGPF
ncbi:MAG: helix-turn-helix domain-containing protein [Clostridia bacterium]|nr:helix-turn-helix domain-containing protein [Clostridia bacterium]